MDPDKLNAYKEEWRAVINYRESALQRGNRSLHDILAEQVEILNFYLGSIHSFVTDLEQGSEANTLRISGMEEELTEDTSSVILQYFREYLGVSVMASDISSCYRIDTGDQRRPRAIIVKFQNPLARHSVWQRRNDCPASGVVIEENLCEERQRVRQLAIERYGPDRVEVVNGDIVVRLLSGRKMTFSTTKQFLDYFREN